MVADRIQFGPRRDGASAPVAAAPSSPKEDSQEAPPIETIDYPEDNVNVDDIPF